MPSQISAEVGFFDRFASAVSNIASRAPFFAICVLVVMIWAPSYFLFSDIDTWQLIINTATTIITFLMVALLQNSQHRADAAVQHKLNATADALADLMGFVVAIATKLDVVDEISEQLGHSPEVDINELRSAVGLEERESSTGR